MTKELLPVVPAVATIVVHIGGSRSVAIGKHFILVNHIICGCYGSPITQYKGLNDANIVP